MIVVGVVAGAAAVGPQLVTALVSAPPPPARPAPTPAAYADSGGRVTLRADADGHFRTDAVIAGRRIPALVDTGATVVTLSYDQGRALGLARAGDRFDVPVQTANGAAGAMRVMLSEVRIGSISVRGVEALVLSDGAMDGALLGMSFLGRLKRMEATSQRLTLER